MTKKIGARRPDLHAGLARALDVLGVIDAALLARRFLPPPLLPALTYHRLALPSPGDSFDRGVVDASAGEFERQVALLVRSFTLVGVDELWSYFYQGRPLPPNPAMITFDDGYRSCHDVALPILARHRAKAVFFVSTGHVGGRRVFWWDKISYLVYRSARRRLVLERPAPAEYDLEGDRAPVVRALLSVVKVRPRLDVDGFVAEVARAAGVPWDERKERQFADELVMTWDHARALRRAGMGVQSHSRWHRVLHTLSEPELDAELGGSRADLEAALDESPRAVAYPVGHGPAPGSPFARAVVRAGYELGFTNATGTNLLREGLSPLHLRRIAVEPGRTQAYFRASVALPLPAQRAGPPT
ncbi:MAG TPA: polysaccharide deacetylase family protein [Polyangiaceae bacterium]|nr:polysaccharide deacetylase family protein [Polyangiaceae bacterium]